ncbi:MAG: sirohydrochlorin chelatase [Rhizobiaceae bacterium]
MASHLNIPKDVGIMVCGHGSRNQNAAKEFSKLAVAMRKRFPEVPVEYGYLEFCNPVLHSGLDALRDKGVKHILAVPGMLFAAGHAKNDIPSVLNSWAAVNPEVTVSYGRELGVDLKMIRAAGERIEQALDQAGDEVAHSETLLLVVGRGASDPDANSNVSKITRMLWEGMGFGWAETAYSGVTFPLVEPALEHVARLGYRRVVVFPYFLFTGVLVKRIYNGVDAVAGRNKDIEFIKAGYLNDHALVLDTLADRVGEILDGKAVMNCQMCKYREQVLGFEAEVGAAQESHHHHVEGVGGAPENCPCNGDCDGSCRDEDFCREHGLEWTPVHSHSSPGSLEAVGHHHDHEHEHEHEHGHDHHHAPYPHADHPLGPKSMEKGKS